MTLFDRPSVPQEDRRPTFQKPDRERVSPCALADVPLDCRARVADVSALPVAQREQLHGYGLLPGRVLRVMQRTPVTVVQIDHIELAIELEVAQAVQVDELMHNTGARDGD